MGERTLGKYTVIRALSSSGPVEVYEARDPQLDRRVAIKVIHPPAAADADFEDRFRRVAKLVAGLRHPHIIQVFDFDFVGGVPFMVMEFLEGGTLADKLAEYPARGETMPPVEAVRVLEPLADALDSAHSQGVVHGAVSAANILFTARGQPVLTDFGVAQILGGRSLANLSGSGGSPAYVSPEQAAGKSPDARSDVYSLGALLFEMVAGRPPFVGGSPAEVMLQHLSDPAPSPRQFAPQLPEPAALAIGKSLAKDPAARYPSSRDLIRTVASALRGEPAAAAAMAQQQSASASPRWLNGLAGAAEVMAPLVGRQAPSVHGATRDRRSLLATIIGIVGIMLAAMQFIVAAMDVMSRGVNRAMVILPYLIVALLCVGGALSVLVAVRSTSNQVRRRAIILFCSTLVVGLAWGGWAIYDRVRPPSGIVIAIADFDSKASRQVDFARRIHDLLLGEIADTGGSVILQRTFQGYADAPTARRQGSDRKAALVIWGWYDDAGVSPHVELLRIPQLARESFSLPSLVSSAAAASSAGPTLAGNWTLRDVAHYVQQPLTMPDFDVFVKNGPQQMAYVSTVLLGLIFFANGDPARALSFYDKALANAPSGGSDIIGQEIAYFQRATLFYQQNRLEEARADLEQALAVKPDFYEAHHNLAILYSVACTPTLRLDRAIGEAVAAVRLKPESAAAHRLLGDLYRQAGQPDRAIAELEAAQRSDPGDAQVLQSLAAAYDLGGQGKRARETALQAVAIYLKGANGARSGGPGIDPSGSHLDLGDAYLRADELDKALAEFQTAQRLAPSDPRVYRAIGNAYYWKGQPADAEREYQRWTNLAPQDPTGHLLLGMLYQEEKKGSEALAELKQAVALATCGISERLVLAGAQFNAGDYEQAAQEYRMATQIDPNSADAFYLLGATRLLQADSATSGEGQGAAPSTASHLLEEAAGALERAVALQPGFAQAHFALGSARYDRGEYEEAATAWEASIMAKPDEPSYYTSAGNAYWKLARWDDSSAAYQKSLDLRDDSYVRVYLGQTYVKQKKVDAAIAEFERAAKSEPKNALAWGSLAETLEGAGKLAEAAVAYRQGLAANEDATLRTQLALVYLRQGDVEAGIRELRKVIALDPRNVPMLVMLGNLLAQTGETDEAALQYQAALAIQPGNAEAHFNLAGVEIKRCNLSTAAQEAKSAASLAPAVSLYAGLRGGIYEAQGREDDAAEVFGQLKAAPSSDALAHLMAGGYLARRSAAEANAARLDESVHELQRSLEAADKVPALASLVHLTLGQVFYTQKKSIAAQNELKAALAASSANAEALAWLGDLYLRDGDPTSAIAAYEQAATLLPQYGLQISADNARILRPSLSSRRGLALARQGKNQEAAAAFDRAISEGQSLLESAPGWAQAHFGLGISYLAKGDPTAADAEFSAAYQCDLSLASQRPQVEANLRELQGK